MERENILKAMLEEIDAMSPAEIKAELASYDDSYLSGVFAAEPAVEMSNVSLSVCPVESTTFEFISSTELEFNVVKFNLDIAANEDAYLRAA